MTNPFTRGSAPGRARDAHSRRGSFKQAHKKLGGRKRGTPNLISIDYKKALLEAAYESDTTGTARTVSLAILCGWAYIIPRLLLVTFRS